MPRNRVRPPAPLGYMRVDQVAVLFNVSDEQVRVWIRGGKLSAELHRWRGARYYLIAQADVDRILLGEPDPLDRTPALAGERGSASTLLLGLGGVGTLAVLTPAVLRDVAIGVGALTLYCAVIAALWAMTVSVARRGGSRRDRP